ncbi:hypothetical protein ZEAMMB73_Zm00001d052600 [Zea mays]|uniref:RNase H type-1 domain-containing protein n=1 Tax=Zea mays TaxID=4577 RepID=K7U749_MAIZE|nr:hypothetical protein ZEAMMB73_Zm00001d052600 [Zea mays]
MSSTLGTNGRPQGDLRKLERLWNSLWNEFRRENRVDSWCNQKMQGVAQNVPYPLPQATHIIEMETEENGQQNIGESGVTVVSRGPLVTWAKDLLADDRFTDFVKTMVICGAWSLWSRRNARRFGHDRWNPNATTGKGAGSIVMRNSQGEVLAAATQLYEHTSDALISKALVAHDGVMLAQLLSMKKVILEVDNSVMVALLLSDEGRRCAASRIVISFSTNNKELMSAAERSRACADERQRNHERAGADDAGLPVSGGAK